MASLIAMIVGLGLGLGTAFIITVLALAVAYAFMFCRGCGLVERKHWMEDDNV